MENRRGRGRGGYWLIGLAFCGLALAAPKPGAGEKGMAPEAQLRVATERFGLDVYRELAQHEPGNLVVSPESLATALAMLSAGARGPTLEEILKTLHWDGSDAELHEAEALGLSGWRAPPAAAKGRGDTETLRMANAIWGQKGYAFAPTFEELLKLKYGALVGTADFQGHPDQSRQEINSWVGKQTEEKIPTLLPPRSVTSATRLLVLNATYFKGQWIHPFAKASTEERPFWADGKSQIKAPTMTQKETFPFLEGRGFQAVQLPFRGRGLALVVLLPEARDGLAALEKRVLAEGSSKLLTGLKPRMVDLALPRFHFGSRLSLADTLRRLGMRKAFGSGADFGRMSPEKGLAVSDVLHEAQIDVNEFGAEAAAATAVMMFGAAMMPGEPVVMKVDHPFLFALRNTRTGNVLFLGRVTKPN